MLRKVEVPLMFEAFLRKLMSICRKDSRESLLIRDQKPRMLSPDVRRALKRLQQDCEEDSSDKADVE